MQPQTQPFLGKVRQALDDFGDLAQLNAALCRAELGASAANAARGAVMAGVACVWLLLALAFLGVSAFIALVLAGLTPLWAGLSLTIGCAVLGAVFVALALASFHAVSLVPRRALAQMRENLEALKTGLSDAEHQR